MLYILCHLFEDSQTIAYMKNLDTLLHLAGKKVTANELQYFSNKTNKQTEIYTLRLNFKTQLKNSVFCDE